MFDPSPAAGAKPRAACCPCVLASCLETESAYPGVGREETVQHDTVQAHRRVQPHGKTVEPGMLHHGKAHREGEVR